MRLPGEPAVSISVTGNGPLTRWTGKATAALDGREVLKVDGEHTLAPDGFRTMALKGGGTFSDLLPAAFRPLFEGTTDIDLSAALDGTTMRIQRGKFTTAAFAFSASGTYSTLGQNDLQASLTGTNGPINFRLPLAKGRGPAVDQQCQRFADRRGPGGRPRYRRRYRQGDAAAGRNRRDQPARL